MLGRDEALAGFHDMGVLERLLGATFSIRSLVPQLLLS
jgi:hypothetical protein